MKPTFLFSVLPRVTAGKKFLVISLTTVVLLATPVSQARAINIVAVIQQAVVRVIRAVDLMIQRMQNETIALQNAAKVLENKLSQLKLTEIAEWTERQRELYREYFDELWKVRNTIATYKRVQQIMSRQVQLVNEYKFTWRVIKDDNHFSREEIDYMYRVYTGIINESVHNLDRILLVINSFKTQMTDARRLEMINNAGEGIEQNYADLKQFNDQNIQLSLNRAKDQHEIETIKELYDLPQ
jgi:hypothetical protein